jgi:uncharacterized protein YycO
MHRTLMLWLLVLAAPAAAEPRPEPAVKTGDVVLQTSTSSQSKAIQLATGSPYSHVGLIEVAKDGTFVLEAIQPVSRTPWSKWRKRGVGGKVTVLRTTGVSDEKLSNAIAAARAELGKPYDFAFGWGDNALYCSELVRKAFERGAGIELGKLQRLDSLHIAGVDAALKARYGTSVPLDLMVITPASIASDPNLEQVFSSF